MSKTWRAVLIACTVYLTTSAGAPGAQLASSTGNIVVRLAFAEPVACHGSAEIAAEVSVRNVTTRSVAVSVDSSGFVTRYPQAPSDLIFISGDLVRWSSETADLKKLEPGRTLWLIAKISLGGQSKLTEGFYRARVAASEGTHRVESNWALFRIEPCSGPALPGGRM